MKDFDAFKMPTSPALDAIRQLQENSAFSAAIKMETKAMNIFLSFIKIIAVSKNYSIPTISFV